MPMPALRNENTIAILVKDVVRIRIAGARVNTVRIARIPRAFNSPPWPDSPSIRMSMLGMMLSGAANTYCCKQHAKKMTRAIHMNIFLISRRQVRREISLVNLEIKPVLVP